VVAQPSSRAGERYAVRFVIDGDTVDVAGAGRVRLLGIDAPEIGRGFDTSAPFAVEARERLRSLLVTRWVRLEGDREARDGYGRVLAYVIRDDGLFVNAELLRLGLARVSARRPLRRLAELRAAEDQARLARRGMWGDRPAVPSRSYLVPRIRSRRRMGRRARGV
jgi:micrococcal nuclease